MIDVLHHSDELLVINKPANVSLLSDRSGAPCLWEELKLQFNKPHMVHRLDKGTSGVLAIALNVTTQKRLTRAFASREVSKYYVAQVVGELRSATSLQVDLPLKKGRKSRYRIAGQRADIRQHAKGWNMAAADEQAGHSSSTTVRALEIAGGRTTLLLKPRTGRTHQLRVHLSWIGYPIVGDTLYGKPASTEQQAPRMMLHAHRLVLPAYGSFSAPVQRSFFANR